MSSHFGLHFEYTEYHGPTFIDLHEKGSIFQEPSNSLMYFIVQAPSEANLINHTSVYCVTEKIHGALHGR